MSAGKTVDFGKAFNFGVERLKANPGMMLGMGGLVFGLGVVFMIGIWIVLFAVMSAIVAVKAGAWLIFPVEIVLFTLMQGVIFGLLIPGFFTCLERESRGETTSFGDLYKDLSKFRELFIAAALSYLAVSVGMFLCVIPGIVALPATPIAMYLAWKGMPGVEAVKMAFSILFTNLLAGAYLLLMLIIATLGAILCFVGVIATAPVGYAGCWHICRQLCGDVVEPAPAPVAEQQP